SWKSLRNHWIRRLPPMRSGMATRPMMKVLVRTAALYSRAATTSILRMSGLLLVGRPGDAHEDVMQARAGQLEVAHPAALHEPGEQFLRVGPRVEPDFLPAPEVGHLGDARQVGQSGTAFEQDVQGVASVGVLDRFQRPVEDFLALVDHEQKVTHL